MNDIAWYQLGNLLHHQIGDYPAAETAYRKAIENEYYRSDYWIELGDLLQDQGKRFEEAKAAYQKALEVYNHGIQAIYSLIFLLRDKLQDFAQSRELFEKHRVELEKDKDSFQLQIALFAIYEDNWGLAKKAWLEASATIVDWEWQDRSINEFYKACAITHKLGYGQDLLQTFRENGIDRNVRPLYEALQALVLGDKEYLLNIAVEVRTPAEKIFDYMRAYLK